MIGNEPARWITQLQPPPGWAIEAAREDSGWIIEGRWWGQPNETASDGPREVVIRLSDDASPDVRQRGINSGVLRRLEQHLRDMTAQMNEEHGMKTFSEVVRAHVKERVSQLPEGPRQGGSVYYTGLLQLFEEVTGMGYPEPLNLIAEVMGIPKDTLKTRLRAARQRQGSIE
ncbi:hypothetical protein [Micromonospora trifolii]|uniref:hypothetical protein n=1 Tax=Micromonospora trifolii TaxID=2911208 RepID=UPI003CF3173C